MTIQYDEVLKRLAPCGLSCEKCFAFTQGHIADHAKQLKMHLADFDAYAERFSAFLPAFQNYPQFKDMLAYFAEPDCKGCREGTCKYPNCGVVECYQSKGVDFCFRCDEFPCDHSNFDPHLHKRWVAMNERMKEIGVEAFYEETKNQPRYK